MIHENDISNNYISDDYANTLNYITPICMKIRKYFPTIRFFFT